MTTREQLGLNANWIPMDFSKSGGSDEFLVKKVNQLEEKVNGLEDSTYFTAIQPTYSGGSAMLSTSLVEDGGKLYASIYLKNTPDNVIVKFRLDGVQHTITLNKPLKVEIPEILDTKLAEYGIHAFYKSIELYEIKVKGLGVIAIEDERSAIESGFTTQRYEQSNGSIAIKTYKILKESPNLSKDIANGKRAKISETRAKLGYLFEPLNLKNTFQAKLNLLDTAIYLHPSLIANYSSTGKLTNTKSVKFLQVSDVDFMGVHFKETEIIWKPLEEVVKDKLAPMLVTGERGSGVKPGYGYLGNKSGLVVMTYSPSLAYAYATDCSDWLIYSFSNINEVNIKNAKQVPRTMKEPFGLRSEDGYGKITVNPYEYKKPEYKAVNYRFLQQLDTLQKQLDAISSLEYRNQLGLVESDFNNGKTYEVWTLPTGSGIRSITNNNLQMNSGTILSIINKETGEFIEGNGLANLYKNERCAIHQTLGKDGDKIVIKSLEIVTLDVFFKNFIAKSEEWKTKNPGKVEELGNPKGNFDRLWTWDEYYDRL